MICFFVSIAFSFVAWGVIAAGVIWPELRGAATEPRERNWLMMDGRHGGISSKRRRHPGADSVFTHYLTGTRLPPKQLRRTAEELATAPAAHGSYVDMNAFSEGSIGSKCNRDLAFVF